MVVKRTLVVLLAAALVGAASVGAADQPAPAGFTANVKLSAAASWVAGKPVTDYCASSAALFLSASAKATGVDNPYASGYSTVGATNSFLHPTICETLAKWTDGKKVDLDLLGAALLTVGHEAELLSGVSDESIADCKALAAMPKMIAKFFPLKKRATLHVVMRDAWDVHDGEPDVYHTYCLSR